MCVINIYIYILYIYVPDIYSNFIQIYTHHQNVLVDIRHSG